MTFIFYSQKTSLSLYSSFHFAWRSFPLFCLSRVLIMGFFKLCLHAFIVLRLFLPPNSHLYAHYLRPTCFFSSPFRLGSPGISPNVYSSSLFRLEPLCIFGPIHSIDTHFFQHSLSYGLWASLGHVVCLQLFGLWHQGISVLVHCLGIFGFPRLDISSFVFSLELFEF